MPGKPIAVNARKLWNALNTNRAFDVWWRNKRKGLRLDKDKDWYPGASRKDRDILLDIDAALLCCRYTNTNSNTRAAVIERLEKTRECHGPDTADHNDR